MRLSIFIILSFILSCSSNTGVETPEYPKQIGTWQINSPEQAEWVGTSSMSKAKVDTLIFTEPGDHGLEIKQIPPNTDPGDFSLVLMDSTIQWQSGDDTWNNYVDTNLRYGDTGYAFGYGGSSLEMSENTGHYLKASFSLGFICGNSGYEPLDEIHVWFADKDTDEIFKYYIFMVSGVEGAVSEISCK